MPASAQNEVETPADLRAGLDVVCGVAGISRWFGCGGGWLKKEAEMHCRIPIPSGQAIVQMWCWFTD